MGVSGGLQDQMNWRAITANTQGQSPSNAATVIEASPGLTTWRCISKGISEQLAANSDDAMKKTIKSKKNQVKIIKPVQAVIWFKVNMLVLSRVEGEILPRSVAK